VKLQCNIERKGRIGRVVIGMILDLAGAVFLILALTTRESVYLFPGIGLTIGGLFMILEGAIGWCAIRAMGFKTKY